MNEYAGFASVYDALTQDVPYEQWIEQYENIWRENGGRPKLLLDLACGTGTLSCMIARGDVEVIGVDHSPEMLSVARRKAEGISPAPLFIEQSMDELDLYGTVDGAICALDSVNYIQSAGELARVFGRVSLFLEPGRLFVFDINTERKLRMLNGKTIVKETENLFCVWQNDYNPRRKYCDFIIDVFIKDGPCIYRRISEIHRERAYSLRSMRGALERSGMRIIGIYPGEGAADIGSADRIFIAAVKL